MKFLIYFLGSLGIAVFFIFFLLSYIDKILFWIKVRKIAKRMAEDSEGEGKEVLENVAKATKQWIKDEKL